MSRAQVVDERKPVEPRDGGDLLEPRPLLEADHAEVRLMDAQQHGRLRPGGVAEGDVFQADLALEAVVRGSVVGEGFRRLAEDLAGGLMVSMPSAEDFDHPEYGALLKKMIESARGTPEDRMRVLLAGYQSYLVKPVEPAELVAVIANLAGRTGTSP